MSCRPAWRILARSESAGRLLSRDTVLTKMPEAVSKTARSDSACARSCLSFESAIAHHSSLEYGATSSRSPRMRMRSAQASTRGVHVHLLEHQSLAQEAVVRVTLGGTTPLLRSRLVDPSDTRGSARDRSQLRHSRSTQASRRNAHI